MFLKKTIKFGKTVYSFFGIKFSIHNRPSKMKLGISYNVFDGEELLPASLLNIRKHADYINVVYQTVSNFGEVAPSSLEPFLNKLHHDGLVDKLIHFTPDFTKDADDNELAKRNIGLADARNASCTHFMTMDVDEFYFPDQFQQAKAFISKNHIDVSACLLYNYITPTIRQASVFPISGVSFIFKIEKRSCFEKSYFPVLVDPTRRVTTEHKKFYFFMPNELALHHYTYVRNDIVKKIMNSTFLCSAEKKLSYANALKMKELLLQPETEIIENFKFDNMTNFNEKRITFIKVEDYFNIGAYLQKNESVVRE